MKSKFATFIKKNRLVFFVFAALILLAIVYFFRNKKMFTEGMTSTNACSSIKDCKTCAQHSAGVCYWCSGTCVDPDDDPDNIMDNDPTCTRDYMKNCPVAVKPLATTTTAVTTSIPNPTTSPTTTTQTTTK
uniref:Uncharacterized protein n=1 Tax=viral metagenome TaxID=1070528 RepID=A0A6C0F342_9ZZZZ